MGETSNILGVLSGNNAVKVEVSISTKSIVILCTGLVLVIALGTLIFKSTN